MGRSQSAFFDNSVTQHERLLLRLDGVFVFHGCANSIPQAVLMKGFSRDEAELELITGSGKRGWCLSLLRGSLGWAVEFRCDYKDVEMWEATRDLGFFPVVCYVPNLRVPRKPQGLEQQQPRLAQETPKSLLQEPASPLGPD